MFEKAQQFIDDWIEINIHPTGYEPEGNNAEAHERARECWAEADIEGISRPLIQAAVGDLVSYMASAIEGKNDEEVQRLVAKHD